MAGSTLVPVFLHGERVAFAIVDATDAERVLAYRWRLNSDGYAMTGRQRRGMHRIVLDLADDDARHVDHRNRNPLDNRRRNLRLGTRALNNQNRPSNGGSSAYRGVTWHAGAGRWQASVGLDGRSYYLGLFEDEEAAAARAAAFRAIHMPFSEEAA